MAIQIPGFATDQQYPFWYLRKMASSFATAGVVNPSTDFIVSPSSGLQVQATSGVAYVQQTVNIEGSAAYNGLYFCVNDATSNPFNTISAPISNPRIDQVILRVYDVQEQGLGGSSKVQIEWLQGTESASASLVTMGPGLTNPGAAVLPANSLRLAYVLQTVGEVSISSGNILNVTGRTDLGAMSSQFVNMTTSANASSGQLVLASPSVTVTLPPLAAAGSAPIKVVATNAVTGSSPVTVSGGSATIWGVGLAATSFLLGSGASYAILEPFSGGWLITSGQQDTGWVPLTITTGAQFASAYTVASKLVGNRVWLRGGLTGGGANMFTLPIGSRPTAAQVWLAGGAIGGSTPTSIEVLSSGIVNGNSGAIAYNFDGLSFSTT